MSRIDELKESTQSVMRKPPSSGMANDWQMRQLLANSVEASYLTCKAIEEFRKYVEDYGKKADKFAKTGRIIAFTSIAVSILAVLVAIWGTTLHHN